MICRHCYRIIKEKSVKKGNRHYHESCMNTIQQQEEQTEKERIKQQQANQIQKKIVLENLVQKGVTTKAKANIEPPNHYDEIIDDEYHAAMEEIRNEIREYEEKYGDKAMEYMRFDSVIRELTREVTAEEMIAEFKQKLQSEKERESKEWDKLFDGGQPVKRELTTNNPLEVFRRITYGRI